MMISKTLLNRLHFYLIFSRVKKKGCIQGRIRPWPFKSSIEILKKIRLAGPACDLNEGLQQASNFSNVALNQKQPILFDWEKFSSFRKLQRVVAFMLRLSPKHRHYRTKVKEIIDPVELETAKQRLLLISQKESLVAEDVRA